ncbi:hypothetical protein ABW21_db0204235 [Orbilia brochopaga]|nr:hypothetical protein ABW21_db0204235 [Drechslerella brochopaga]
MTLHAPDPKHPFIMMEKFIALTSSSECSLSEKKLTIKFKSGEAMEQVTKSWSQVNVKHDFFYLIANNPSCCPDGQRRPYEVDGIKYEKEALTAVLSIKGHEWKDVAGNFDLNLGRYNVPKHSKRHAQTAELTKRWFHPGAIGVSLINKLGIAPDIDYMESLYMSMDLGRKNRRTELLDNPFQEEDFIEVHCVDCDVSGGIEIGLRCKAEHGKIKELYVFAQPKDLRAKLEVEFKTERPTVQPLDYKQSVLPDLALPGFSIPGIFTFGPSLQINLGLEVNFHGTVSATAGVEVNMPNEAFIVADIIGTKSGASGFDTLDTSTSFSLNEASAEVEASLQIGPALALGIKALNTFGFEAVVQFKMPYLEAQGNIGREEGGFCPHSEADSETETGGKVQLSCDFEIWLEIGAAQNPLIPLPVWLPEVERILWNIAGPSKEFCKAFPIPRLSGGGAGLPPAVSESPTAPEPALTPTTPKSLGSGIKGPNGETFYLVFEQQEPPVIATPLPIDP